MTQSENRIPVAEILQECDKLFNSNRSAEAGALLRAWRVRAQELGDKSGELTILSELMGHYRMAGDSEHGIAAVNDGVSLIEELKISDSLSAGTIYINAATALSAFGRFAEALELYQKASKCYTAHLESDDVRFAGLFNNMASVHLAAGDFSTAEELYLKSVELLSAKNSLMDLAVTYVNLAQLYYAQDRQDIVVSSTLDCAMLCFDSPAAVRDGYYAHTCGKCAQAFGMMGRSADEAELNSRAGSFYAGT
ncbi:MAG: tetratricopeptide repeat protein [Lentisphaeria bacterium]|nr:tetratricopeptide repeat protein [Lentisphaeria bacterium]